MASDLERKAKEAFVDDDFELAVDLYSEAIKLDPNNGNLFADRAQANIKLANFTEAVADANKAIHLDASMAKAYLRKGTACLKLEEFQTAKAALESGASLAPADARFSNFIKECNQRISEEAGDLSTKSVPGTTSATTFPEKVKAIDTISQPTPVVPAKPKYRHEYYQKPEEVVVTIFAKGVKPEHLVVDFGEQILSVTIEIPGEDVYHFQPRLFGKIKPENCKYLILSTKIEIRLTKVETINWTGLEFSSEPLVAQKINTSSAIVARPTYPSSKSRAKNWDEIEAQVKKEEKDEKLDGDAALNKFFRDIYQGADEDVRRAMSKSFVESNGTVLSTDWKEVGAKKIEGSPPDGMEMKKWEY
ncbi:Cochaperone protein [Ranunculus cassubicifolius]